MSKSTAKPTTFVAMLWTRKTAVLVVIAAAGTIAGNWLAPSQGTAPSPSTAINVSPVQSVQQSVQINGTQAAAASVEAGPLVAIVGASGMLDGDLTSRASRELVGNGGEAIEPATFSRAFAGDAAALSGRTDLAGLPLIVLGRVRTAFAVATGPRQAQVVLDLRIYEPRAGFATRTAQLTAAGESTSEAEAQSQAYAHLVTQLGTAVWRLR